jgi:hypothetical protein
MEAMEEAPELLGNIAQVKKADGNIRRVHAEGWKWVMRRSNLKPKVHA